MDVLRQIFSNDWAQAMGWTLLHSLWQSAVIFLVVIAVLRFLPTAFSKVRYALACVGMLLLFISGVATFIYFLQHEAAEVSAHQAATNVRIEFTGYHATEISARALFSGLNETIERSMPFILTAWVTGFLFFTLRLSTGLWHTGRLRAAALPLDNQWSSYIRNLSRQLGISRLVALAESPAIKSPMVIGYLKPVILVPAGMLTGLTTEQLETIFVHELAHIKRHDYLINLIQSFLETVFFFNPFVWILSSIVRKEREYCCDDLVVQHHGDSRAYAYALTNLAEARLSAQPFALSLAADKNQLLNRIRRIMEKSTKTHSGKTRILLPAILVTGGLLSISWLGIQQEKTPQSDSPLVEQDTIIGDTGKGAFYSRKSIITIDKDGKPHEEVVETFEGDEELRPLMEQGIPPIPDISMFRPMLPPNAVMPALPHMNIPGIPDSLPVPLIPFKGDESWQEMAKAFEERFEEFALRNADAEKIMKEFEQQFKWEDWTAKFDSLKIEEDVLRGLEDFQGFHELEEKLEHLHNFETEDFRNLERNLERQSKNLRGYEQVLREELIKDGYLSKTEAIESLQWDETMFKVNGKKIKDSELKKYQEIHDKFFNTPDVPDRVE